MRETQYFGAFTRLRVQVQTLELQVDLPSQDRALPPPDAGNTVHLHWDDGAVTELAPEPLA